MKVSVVHTGARDHYEVAAAFAETSELDRLMTSSYFKKSGPLRALGRSTKAWGRRHDVIPDANVDALVSVDVAKRVGGLLGMEPQFSRLAELALARYAAARACNSDVLVSYNYLAHLVFPQYARKKVLFQCHPNPAALQDEMFRGVNLGATGFALEREIAWGSTYKAHLENEWQLADRIIVASSFVKESLLRAGAEPARIAIVPYGCDAPVRTEARSLVPGAKRKLLFVGQLVWRKGADLLAPLMRTLGASFELVIVTRGLYDVAIMRELTATPGVTMHRNVSRSALDELYSAADAFLFPSRFEGYGLVINEALARGLPVLATRNTALADIVAVRPAGIVLPEVSVDAVAEGVQRLFDDAFYPMASLAALDYARGGSWEQFRRGVRAVVAEVA